MTAWTCAECGRSFGRRNQSHECAPAMTLDEYFSTGPPRERPIFEAVRDHLESLGEVEIEAVQVGIFFKRGRTFVELRTRDRWVALFFGLTATIDHPRIARRIKGGGRRMYYAVNLREPDEVDDTVKSWLTASYLETAS